MTFRLKAASGPNTGQTFNLADQDTDIGSVDSADIQLEGIESSHARIRFDGETLMLEADYEAFVNGQPVARQPLKSGDEIRLGAHRFVLQAPGLRPPSVLQQTEQRQPISPWTWVAIVGTGIAGFAAIASLVLTRL